MNLLILAQIAVVSASYGVNVGAVPGNMTASVAAACNGLTSCLTPKPLLTIGDPVPGKSKDFAANWRCGSDPTIRTVTAPPEAGYASLQLSCAAATPTPTPTPSSTCVPGQVCYRLQLVCAPPRTDCPTMVLYVRTFEGVTITFQPIQQ